MILVRQDDKNTREFVTIFIVNLTRSIINIFLVLVLVLSPIRPLDSVQHLAYLSPFAIAWCFSPRGFLPLIEEFKMVLILILIVTLIRLRLAWPDIALRDTKNGFAFLTVKSIPPFALDI